MFRPLIRIFSILFILISSLRAQVCISFIGDCTIGNDIRWPEFDKSVAKKGYAYFFSNVKNVLSADDYTVANLETAIIDSGTAVEKEYRFRGKPEYLNILKQGGVECVTIANNHTHNYGDEGFASTKKYLAQYGIDFFGYETHLARNIKGVKFAFIGNAFHLGPNTIAYIKAIRDSVDFIVVVMHWGEEKQYEPDEEQKALARELINAGADLIVGHHPHVLQPIEKYKGKYIAYSLGNFVFGGNRNPHDKKTMILQGFFEKGKPVTVKQIPCRISSEFCPIVVRRKD